MYSNRCQRQQVGRLSVSAAVGIGGMGALWLGGVAVAVGSGLPLWAPFAVLAVVAGVVGVFLVLIKLSHGGDWGWEGMQRPPRRARAASWR